MGSVLCRCLSVRRCIALAGLRVAGLCLAGGLASGSTAPAQSPFVVDAAHLTRAVDRHAPWSDHTGNDSRRAAGREDGITVLVLAIVLALGFANAEVLHA